MSDKPKTSQLGFGLLIFVVNVLGFVLLTNLRPVEAQQQASTEPRIESLVGGRGLPEVYVLTDRNGCQYLLSHAGAQGMAMTPRMAYVPGSLSSGPIARQAGCRVRG